MGISGCLAQHRRSFRKPSLEYRGDCTFLKTPPLQNAKTLRQGGVCLKTILREVFAAQYGMFRSIPLRTGSSDLSNPFRSKNRIFREFEEANNRGGRCVGATSSNAAANHLPQSKSDATEKHTLLELVFP